MHCCTTRQDATPAAVQALLARMAELGIDGIDENMSQEELERKLLELEVWVYICIYVSIYSIYVSIF